MVYLPAGRGAKAVWSDTCPPGGTVSVRALVTPSRVKLTGTVLSRGLVLARVKGMVTGAPVG